MIKAQNSSSEQIFRKSPDKSRRTCELTASTIQRARGLQACRKTYLAAAGIKLFVAKR